MEQFTEPGYQLWNILAGVLRLKALDERVNRVAAAADDLEVVFIVCILNVASGKIKILDHGGDKTGMFFANVLGKIVRQTSHAIERGSTNLELRVFQEMKDHGQDLVQLRGDEVRRTFHTHTES
jgi:hypothetical protein